MLKEIIPGNRRWWAAALAILVVTGSLVGALLHASQEASLWIDDLAELVAPLAAAAACVFAARHQRGRSRAGWALVGASAATWAAGQAAWSWLELIAHQENPFPSVADIGYVGAVPLLLVGLFILPAWPAGGAGAKLRAFSDGLLVAGGLLLISWHTVLGSIAASPSDSALAQALSLTYPTGDVVVVTVLLVMSSRALPGVRGGIMLLAAGLGLIAVSDSTFAYQQAQNAFGSGSVIDMGWVAGYLFVGLAALYAVSRPVAAATPAAPRWRSLLVPYIPIPVALVFTVHERLTDGRISTFTLACAAAIIVLILGRQALAVLENVQLLRRVDANETELHHRAEHDPLTDLANRSTFIRRVDARLLGAAPGCIHAVLFVDLDDFKQINDSLGHAVGDQAIVDVGRRLQSCMRGCDLVARFGGDEFAILLTDLAGVGQLVSIAERLIETLNQPFLTSDMRAAVHGTIGVAIAEAGDDAAELLRRADIAMYAAKAAGKGLFGIFEPSMHVAMYAPLERRAALAQAVEAQQFELHFQPVVDVPTRAMVGVEALLRWRHPQLGLLGPGEFLDDLEEAGLMAALGPWIIAEACRQGVRLRRHTGRDLSVSVNVSSSQVRGAGVVAVVTDALASSGLPPTALVVELTESGSIGDSELVALQLRQLRELGVRIAIDDFGTGYSSFGYLRRLRVDIVKIEKSFVDDLLGGGIPAALVEGMLALGLRLGLDVVAEGVEHEAQHEALARLGCPRAQGYLHARPMPMDQLLARASVWPLAPRRVIDSADALEATAAG